MKHPVMRLAAVLSLAVLAGGCAGFTLAEGGKRVEIGDELSVRPGMDWNRIELRGKYEYWTLDGLGLQNILFVKGVEDGESIIYRRRTGDGEKNAFPVYRKGMTLIEIRELLESTWARRGYHRLRVTRFGPSPFGDRPGFEIAFTFDTKDGLEMRGLAAGAIVEDRLYMAIYSGTRIHFFDRGEKGFREIVRSFRFADQPAI